MPQFGLIFGVIEASDLNIMFVQKRWAHPATVPITRILDY